MVGFVLPDSILEIFVGSITPCILPTSSTCEIPLDSRKFFILFPTSFRISDLSNLTYLTSQRNCIYLLIVMPYMAIPIFHFTGNRRVHKLSYYKLQPILIIM